LVNLFHLGFFISVNLFIRAIWQQPCSLIYRVQRRLE
jgi:hypothetical protein